MSADVGARSEACSHCLHGNTPYSDHTHTHTHTHHTHTHHTHTPYILLFIRNIVQTSYIKCESLKPNFTFLVILFACFMWPFASCLLSQLWLDTSSVQLKTQISVHTTYKQLLLLPGFWLMPLIAVYSSVGILLRTV
jgi:hypothetical protein